MNQREGAHAHMNNKFVPVNPTQNVPNLVDVQKSRIKMTPSQGVGFLLGTRFAETFPLWTQKKTIEP
jgi:hypothetical protein